MNNQELIISIIEASYYMKKSYIEKWFSREEVQEEQLLEENKTLWENGLIVRKESIINQPKGKSITIYQNGKKYKTEQYDENGSLEKREIRVWNNQGDMIEYTSWGKGIIKDFYHKKNWQYFYYPNGLKYKSINSDNSISYYKYDHLNRLNRQVNCDSQGRETMIIQYIYNSCGLYEEIIYDDILNNTKETDICQYDKFGNIIYYKWWDKGVQRITTYEYKYDEYKNWIEIRQYRDGVFNLLKTREYQYKQNSY